MEGSGAANEQLAGRRDGSRGENRLCPVGPEPREVVAVVQLAGRVQSGHQEKRPRESGEPEDGGGTPDRGALTPGSVANPPRYGEVEGAILDRIRTETRLAGRPP